VIFVKRQKTGSAMPPVRFVDAQRLLLMMSVATGRSCGDGDAVVKAQKKPPVFHRRLSCIERKF
jgi:hypothetical protein